MASKRPSKLGMQLHFICRHTALTSIQSSNYFPNSKPCCGRSLHILSRTRLSPSTACARLSLLVCAISLGLSVLHSSPTQDMVSLIGKRSKGHKSITWRLLTTLPVAGEGDEFAAAQEIVRLYRLRWRIEQVFRAMKSDGLRLEETQVTQADRLFNLAAIALVAAARTIQLVDARDGSSRPASDVADQGLIAAAEAIGPTLEGSTARQKNPYQPGSLAWLAWIIARLGGWN